MGRASSSYHIYAMVNNRQAEHQSTVVESSGTLNHINVKILFDSGATDSFISDPDYFRHEMRAEI